jgi:hypothetical protein
MLLVLLPIERLCFDAEAAVSLSEILDLNFISIFPLCGCVYRTVIAA